MQWESKCHFVLGRGKNLKSLQEIFFCVVGNEKKNTAKAVFLSFLWRLSRYLKEVTFNGFFFFFSPLLGWQYSLSIHIPQFRFPHGSWPGSGVCWAIPGVQFISPTLEEIKLCCPLSPPRRGTGDPGGCLLDSVLDAASGMDGGVCLCGGRKSPVTFRLPWLMLVDSLWTIFFALQ